MDPRDGTDRLARSRPWTSPLKPGIGRASPVRDAAFLERFDARMRVPIIVSAIFPLVVVPGSSGWIGVVVGIVTWLVFLADYLIQARHLDHYGRIRLGRFDLFVVIATAPWFLLPGTQAGRFVILLRLARLARLVVASRGSRRLFDRLGRVAAVAVGVVVLGSLVAYYAEHPANPEFAAVGDAVWWGIVTLTTVGYRDIVPRPDPAADWNTPLPDAGGALAQQGHRDYPLSSVLAQPAVQLALSHIGQVGVGSLIPACRSAIASDGGVGGQRPSAAPGQTGAASAERGQECIQAAVVRITGPRVWRHWQGYGWSTSPPRGEAPLPGREVVWLVSGQRRSHGPDSQIRGNLAEADADRRRLRRM